jgi:hypothetical protein
MSKKKRVQLRARPAATPAVSVYSTTVRSAAHLPNEPVTTATNGDYDLTTAVRLAIQRVLNDGRPFSRSLRQAAREHREE